MSKIEVLPESVQCQAHRIVARSEFAQTIDDASEALAKMTAQERSIRDSICDSRKAIEESRILLAKAD